MFFLNFSFTFECFYSLNFLKGKLVKPFHMDHNNVTLLYHKMFCIHHDKLDFMRQLLNYLYYGYCETWALSQTTKQSQNILRQKYYIVLSLFAIKYVRKNKWRNHEFDSWKKECRSARSMKVLEDLKSISKLLSAKSSQKIAYIHRRDGGIRMIHVSSMHTKPANS